MPRFFYALKFFSQKKGYPFFLCNLFYRSVERTKGETKMGTIREMIEQMEKEGVISAPNAAGKREILVAGGE